MSLDDARGQTLAETIETQRVGCELSGSPLYSAILQVVANDVGASGVTARLLDPVADAPFGDAVILRLLAGLHRLVLAGRAPVLADHYPSVGGTPGVGLGDAVLGAIASHEAELAEAMGQGVQTNEVGRSAAMVGGFLEVARWGMPLRILELGASAGLNLAFDSYRYEGVGAALGPTDSALVFHRPWFDAQPDLDGPLEVIERRGCDVAPIDVATPEGRLRLRSFVWADQLDRLARLNAAIEVVADGPPPVDRAGSADWLTQRLGLVAGTCTVVFHSIVFQYLSPVERSRVVTIIESIGVSATEQKRLAWLRLEPAGDQAELRLTTWPGGVSRVLARSSYHGPPVVWLPDTSGGRS